MGALEAGRAARGRADVYHAPHVTIPLGFDGPLVTTVHDLIPLLHPETMLSGPRRSLFRAVVREAVRRSAAILCDTRFAASTLYEAGFQPKSLTVIPPGVGEEFRPQTKDSITAVRCVYGLDRGYILWAGAFRPHKDVATLVRAYASLPVEVRATCDLALAGDPSTPYGNHIRELITKLLPEEAQRVRFLGFVENAHLPGLYAGATVFAFPSLTEGFGLPPLEAAGCCTPIIATDAPPMPEVLAEGALYFGPGNHQELAMLLEELVSKQRLRKAVVGRALARRGCFHWANVIQEMVKAYRLASSTHTNQ